MSAGCLKTGLNPNQATLREMVPIFYEVTHKVSTSVSCLYLLKIIYPTVTQMRDAIAKGITSEATEVDMLHWTTRAALELIGQGGLGQSISKSYSSTEVTCIDRV